MDKLATNEVLTARGIKVVPYIVHHRSDPVPEFSQLSKDLGSPLFTKPSNGGSSIGISKVYHKEEFTNALATAHQYDEVALIELGIAGREVRVAILGNPPHHQISGVGEVKPGADFFSYEAKYSESSTAESVIPADLDTNTQEQIRHLAGEVYTSLGCKGLARVDLFLTNDSTVYVNEINTLPYFTPSSMYPKLWQEEGTLYPELIERLISLALEP